MTLLHYLDPNPDGHPAVLLLHGLGVNAESWTLQLLALTTAGFRPIAPDTPGFGASPYDGRGWTIQRMAAQMAGLIDELGSGPVHLVGLSLGGIIAQQFALDVPNMTRKLVLVSTFTILRPDSVDGWLYFLGRFILVNTLGVSTQARLVARRIFPDPGDKPVRELLVETISRADPRAYRRAMISLGMFNSVNRLEEIKAPTLVVTGEDDTTVSPERQQLLLNGIPHARQELIPHAGHAVPVDQPDLFNCKLMDFLSEE